MTSLILNKETPDGRWRLFSVWTWRCVILRAVFAVLSDDQQPVYVHCSQKTIVATFATLGSKSMYQTTRCHV